MFVVFFFKQKKAYEMRISDWSSDVCSSDLVDPARGPERGEPVRRQRLDRREVRDAGRVARESLFLKDAGDFQNGLRLLLCPLNPGPRSRPPIDIDATRVLPRDATHGLADRKRVVAGKRVAIGCDLGGTRHKK